jgi:hypothetical protein
VDAEPAAPDILRTLREEMGSGPAGGLSISTHQGAGNEDQTSPYRNQNLTLTPTGIQEERWTFLKNEKVAIPTSKCKFKFILA